ncbi:hypothetical protein RIEPE_0082 [Candidatus Riesia pediculicola USDA]|uniref:Uncharacterized protein n=1 Tax=Riesia pediculicola (strain USDA) TaxID=515618 RepID=D4G7P3_RIEPU|nr:hypothetical protein RIEPE_0082 [Candidatus Riesia pediculicola USDA]
MGCFQEPIEFSNQLLSAIFDMNSISEEKFFQFDRLKLFYNIWE